MLICAIQRLLKGFLCFAISLGLAIPAYAEYYVVSPYYPDAYCCCPERVVYVKKSCVKKKIKRKKHKVHKRYCAPKRAPCRASMMVEEYAWIPNPDNVYSYYNDY